MEQFVVTNPLWATLLLAAFFIGCVWRFGKDLDDAKDEWQKGKKEDDKY